MGCYIPGAWRLQWAAEDAAAAEIISMPIFRRNVVEEACENINNCEVELLMVILL